MHPERFFGGVRLSCAIYNTVLLHESVKFKAECICFSFFVKGGEATDSSLFKTRFPYICFDNIDLGLL